MKHLVVSEKLHLRLKRRAIHNGSTVKELTEELLNKALEH